LPPDIVVLAGVNGAGKSSVAGAAFEAAGGAYYNPDRATRSYVAAGLSLPEANARAWRRGVEQLDRAIRLPASYAFETTLGGRTVTRRLLEAARLGLRVRIWYVGLASPELHIERVKARVERGGHDIPEERIRVRWIRSRENLVRLLPSLYEIALFDNSREARLDEGEVPAVLRMLHLRGGALVQITAPETIPSWAKPIVTAVLKLGQSLGP
jgi:predicted ABC-type ATPase